MKIIIKETYEVKTLSIIDPKTGVDYIEDLIGNTGALTNGQFTWDEYFDAYFCDQDTYDWWSNLVAEQQLLKERIHNLVREHGEEAVYEAIDKAGCVDLEDYAANVNRALDEAFADTMKIINVDFTDFDDTTVEVTAEAKNKRETFYVQTVDGEFRSDLGCWIITRDCGEDINYSDYEEFDIKTIIKVAENFLENEIDQEITDYQINGKTVYLLNDRGTFKVVTENPQFINADTSTFQRRFSDVIAEFDSKEEAFEYLDGLEIEDDLER